jgi:acetyltransferase
VSADTQFRLGDRLVGVRALQAADRPLIEHLLRATELHDLQMRFFSAFHSLPPEMLDQLMQIDAQRTVLVAAGEGSGAAEILGVARAHRLGGDAAELAMLVRSDLKGIGLGSLLLERLIACCRSRGIRHLVGDVLQENTRMLRLADKYGFRRGAPRLGTTHLVLNLESRAA